MSAELSNLELGLELELNSDDVAAAEAAVAAHGESLTCSCCEVELTDKDSLHLHQISQHSISQLSIALLALRGLDVSSGLGTEVPQDICCQDSDSESTVSAHSSFMFGFTEEFSNMCPQNEGSVCATSGRNMSAPGTYDCAVSQSSAPNAPQYASDFPGSLNFCGTNPDMGTYGVDMNRNHQRAASPAKVAFAGASGADARQSAAQGHFLTNHNGNPNGNPNGNGMAKAGGGAAHPQGTLFHDVHSPQEVPVPGFVQINKNQESSKKRLLPSKTNAENAADPTATAPKRNKMTCATSADKDGGAGAQAEKQESEYDGREFSCEICGRKYKRKSHLGRHIRMHSGVRPFPCTLCDKRFAVRSILKQHMRVHTGERPFKCIFCCQRFPQKSGLVTHMMLHTGKPYKCDLCDKSFVSNHKLNVHKKAHEEQSGRWPTLGPHACPTCATRFFTCSALAEHAKVHIVGVGVHAGGVHAGGVHAGGVHADDGLRRHLLSEPAASASPDLTGRSSAESVLTHNSQEVTAGQALLTLMDSSGNANGAQEDPDRCPSDRPASPSEASDSDGDGSEVPLHFEFCDVPLDLKPSIYLKEECFDFEDKLHRSDNESGKSGT